MSTQCLCSLFAVYLKCIRSVSAAAAIISGAAQLGSLLRSFLGCVTLLMRSGAASAGCCCPLLLPYARFVSMESRSNKVFLENVFMLAPFAALLLSFSCRRSGKRFCFG